MMCPCGLYIIATFAVVVFGTSNNPVNVTYENYGLSLSTFSLLDGPGESETFDLGEFATMKFEFQTNIDVKDTITMEFSGFYNGYSALILCGEPIIESESEYVLSYDTLDDIAPHRDTMYLEFVGEVDWPTGTLFSITFNIMLISHKDYVVGDIYWFAAAMQYNHERADWVSDIAFELGPLPVVTGDVQMEIVEQPGSLLFNKGGSGMAEIEVKAPFFEVADFFFSAEVNSANPMFDDLCICGLSIIAASQSFLGCSADASLPEYALFVDPPYNETECKKKMLLDFGDLKKIGVTREDDTLKFFLVYRTDKDYDDSGNTLDELFLYSMRNHSGSVLTSLSGQVTVEPYTGSMNDVDVASVGFEHTGPVIGNNLAAFGYMIPMATSRNAFEATLSLTYPADGLTDLRPKVVMTDRGSCCMPSTITFEINKVDEWRNVAVAKFTPFSFLYGGESRIKVAIIGTVAKKLTSHRFDVNLDVGGETCKACEEIEYMETTDTFTYDPTHFPDVQMGVLNKFGGTYAKDIEIYQAGFGMFDMVVTFTDTAPAHELFELHAGFVLDSESSVFRVMHMSDAYLTHVGDNLPYLQDMRDAIKIKMTIETIPNHLPYTISSFTFELPESVTYLPLNTFDVMDRRIVMTVVYHLPFSSQLTYYWKETILGYVSMDDYREDVVSSSVSAILDVSTQEVYPHSDATKTTFMNANGGDIFRATGWPVDDLTVENANEQKYEGKLISGEEKVVVCRAFVTPGKLFNDYALNISVNDELLPRTGDVSYERDPSEIKIADFYLSPGSNVVMYFDDEFKTYRFGSREVYKNESRDNYEIRVFVHVLAPEDPVSITAAFEVKCKFELLVEPSGSLEELDEISIALTSEGSYLTDAHPFDYDKTYDALWGFSLVRNISDEGQFPVKPTPGSVFYRMLDLNVPQQTISEFAIELSVDSFSGENNMAGLWELEIMDAAKYISKTFNRSVVQLDVAKTEQESVGNSEYNTKLVYNLGTIQNLYPNRDDFSTNDPDNMVKLAVVMVVGQHMPVEDTFKLTVTLKDVHENRDAVVVSYVEVIEVVNWCGGFTLYPLYTRSPRSVQNDVTTLDQANATQDFLIKINVEFPPFFNGDPTIYVMSPVETVGGSQFVIRGVEIDQEEFVVGEDLSASFNDSLAEGEMIFKANDALWKYQENSMQYRLGRISVLDLRQRTGYYDTLPLSAGSRARSARLLVYVKVLDEATFSDGKELSLIWALDSGSALMLSQYNFKLGFLADRRPRVGLDVNLAYTLNREFEPGDMIQFLVKMYHECNSTAQATSLKTVVYLPDLIYVQEQNTTHYVGQLPTQEYAFGSDKATMKISKLGVMEYVEFRYDIEVTAGSIGVREDRDYYVTSPIDFSYLRSYRSGSDTSPQGTSAHDPYTPKTKSAEVMYLVTNSSCAGALVPIHDSTLFQECQITASSELDPVEFAIHRGLRANTNSGWRSNSWLGQWESGQYIKLALLKSYKISRVVFNKESSFASFFLHYSNDPEGIYWSEYTEQNKVREFLVNESYVDSNNDRLKYLDIRDPVNVLWVKLTFTGINRDTDLGSKNILSFRFDLVGCPNNFGTVVDIDRVCPVEVVIKDIYDRGFITDPKQKVLFVCEKNLAMDKNECLRMAFTENSNMTWSKIDPRVHSIIGYWISQETIFAVSQSRKTFLASDDGGRSWLTVQTQEYWTASAMSLDSYKPAVKIPVEFYPVDMEDIPSSMMDGWDGVTFAANHEGIWSTNTNSTVYSWSVCCA